LRVMFDRVSAWSENLSPPPTFEYALIILLIGAIIFATLLLYGDTVNNVFSNVVGVLV